MSERTIPGIEEFLRQRRKYIFGIDNVQLNQWGAPFFEDWAPAVANGNFINNFSALSFGGISNPVIVDDTSTNSQNGKIKFDSGAGHGSNELRSNSFIPASSPFYVATCMVLDTNAAASTIFVTSVKNGTSGNTVGIGFNGGLDAANFSLQYHGATTGSKVSLGAKDNSRHWFEMAFDGTKLWGCQDFGNLVSVTVGAGDMPIGSCLIELRNTDNSIQVVNYHDAIYVDWAIG